MLPSVELEPVTGPVRDDQQGCVLGKGGVVLQQVDARLEFGAAPSPHLYRSGDVLRVHYPLVIRGGVTEHHPHVVDIPGLTVTGDGAQGGGQQLPVHGAGGIQHHAEDPLMLHIGLRSPGGTGNVRGGALPPAEAGVAPVLLHGGELLVEPSGQLHIPGNGRPADGADLLDQTGG